MPGPEYSSNVIEAKAVITQNLMVGDSEGKLLATMDKDGFKMYGKGGVDNIHLAILETGTVIALKDSNGNSRLNLMLSKDEPTILLIDNNQNVRATIGYCASAENTTITLYNTKGERQAQLSHSDESGPSLGMFDSKSILRLAAQVCEDSPRVVISDESQNDFKGLYFE